MEETKKQNTQPSKLTNQIEAFNQEKSMTNLPIG